MLSAFQTVNLAHFIGCVYKGTQYYRCIRALFASQTQAEKVLRGKLVDEFSLFSVVAEPSLYLTADTASRGRNTNQLVPPTLPY